MEKYLTEDEINILLSVPLEKRKSLLIHIGLDTGMRVSEVVGMLVRNVNGNFIKIYDYKKNDWRMVVISDKLADELDEYIASITKGKRKPKKMYNVTERTINNWLKQIFLTAKLPPEKAHWHTFRHTFVRRCQHLGLDPSFAVAQTGDSPETILKYYGKPSLDDRLKTLRETPLYNK